MGVSLEVILGEYSKKYYFLFFTTKKRNKRSSSFKQIAHATFGTSAIARVFKGCLKDCLLSYITKTCGTIRGYFFILR